jgi:UDP-GlcNAc:undecaprenyl-phosphate/decaprenyl-phosphate GlcNAc-1-phosphate transferase
MYLLALGSAWVTALSAAPLWRKACVRIGLVDDPGHRKIHDVPVPLAGGLTIVTALVLPLLAGVLLIMLRNSTHGAPAGADPETLLHFHPGFLLRHGFERRWIELAGILFGAVGMLLLGCLDDKYELSPKVKFGGQAAVALVVAASGVRLTLFVPSIVFSYAATVLWLLTVINAFNFMDNMNGLCSGLGALGAWFFAGLAANAGQYLVALIGFLTLGALLGFLPHNFPKARAFLGDSGSHLVGYLLAILAILPHFYRPTHPRPAAVLVPMLVLGIPLLDMGWVVLLRCRIGQPFYQGDTNHLSHRLVARGLSRIQAVVLIWLAAAALGSIACFL